MGFGGPVVLVEYMRRDLVERRDWISEADRTLVLYISRKVDRRHAALAELTLKRVTTTEAGGQRGRGIGGPEWGCDA